MPIVEITLFEGRSDQIKRRIYREVTDALERAMEVDPQKVRIVLHEIPKANLSVAGESVPDREARETAAGSGDSG